MLTSCMQIIQDIIAHNLNSYTIKLDELQDRMAIQHHALIEKLSAFRTEMRVEFAALRTSERMIKSRKN